MQAAVEVAVVLREGDMVLVAHRRLFELLSDVPPGRFTFVEKDGQLNLVAGESFSMNLAEFTCGGR